MIQRDGWNLLFHECLVEQLRKLHAAAERAQKQDPKGSESNANVRLFAALSKLIFEAVPSDPNREEYRQGNTMGPHIGTGGAQKSVGDSACFFVSIQKPESSFSPGSMMNTLCEHPAAKATLTSFSNGCWSVGTHRMIGQISCRRATRTGSR